MRALRDEDEVSLAADEDDVAEWIKAGLFEKIVTPEEDRVVPGDLGSTDVVDAEVVADPAGTAIAADEVMAPHDDLCTAGCLDPCIDAVVVLIEAEVLVARGFVRSILGRTPTCALSSSRRHAMPCWPRMIAVVSPTGPAPTTMTSGGES